MVIEQALVSYVASGLGHSRVYPSRVPENPTYPTVTYQRFVTERIYSHGGPSGLAYPRFQIDSYADTYAVAKQSANAIRTLLDGYKGTMASGVYVSSCMSKNDRDFFDSITMIWRVSTDYIIGHQE